LATATFDGTYWLDSVPKLTNFYVTSQASVYGDEPRPEVVGLIDRYKAKFRKRGHAVRLLGLRLPSALAKAVEKAGTLDLDKSRGRVKHISRRADRSRPALLLAQAAYPGPVAALGRLDQRRPGKTEAVGAAL
jgi:hypothetical protein